MASSVRDVALLLSVIAGYDGIDPRMTPESPLRRAVPQYHVLLDQATTARQLRGEWTPSTAGKGLRVGVLKEGLEIPSLSPDVATVIRKAAQRFEDLGATVTEVSVGHIHHDALAVWAGVIRGQMHEVLLGNRAPDLLSHSLPNLTPPVPDQKWYETMTVSNPAVISALLTGSYLADTKRFGNGYRGKALMHAQQLRDAYDAVFEGVDVLIMPTTPFVAPRQGKHAGGGEGVMENFRAQAHLASNTAPFNITGHPALSMPVGWAPVDGGGEGKLPVGMQIVGRRWDELGVLFAAAAWEVGGFGLDDES
jgi:amidase